MAKVRWGQEKDIPAVKRLADDNRSALGLVVLASPEERMRQHGLLVGECRREVVGQADEATLGRTRELFANKTVADREDLESLIALGRREMMP